MLRTLSQKGSAAVEFLLSLPILLVLALPVVDLARLLQAEIILTSIAREGANLMTRTSGTEQTVMNSLVTTAPPLDMRGNGMIHITKVLAQRANGVSRNVVLDQARWVHGAYMPANGVWTCGASGSYWAANGSCVNIPAGAAAPEIDVMRGDLHDGDIVYLVEAFYRFPMLFGGRDLGVIVLPSFNSNLHAFTIL